MIKKILKEISILIIGVILSFIFDIFIASTTNFPVRSIIILHGTLYLIYAGAIILTKFAMLSKNTVDEFMENKNNQNEMFKTKMVVYGLIAGFSLIAMEIFV